MLAALSSVLHGVLFLSTFPVPPLPSVPKRLQPTAVRGFGRAYVTQVEVQAAASRPLPGHTGCPKSPRLVRYSNSSALPRGAEEMQL